MSRQRYAITLFVFAAAVFRSEVALLLVTSVAHLLVAPETSLERVMPPFVVSFLMALIISVPVDSYFWQKPVWPELWGFYYNAVLGSSSDWGVSPWHYYFVSALPRLLLNPLSWAVLIPVSLRQPSTRRAATRLVVPSLLFVAVYSLQPHKEARFIFYVIPPLTAAAALGANVIFNRRAKSLGAAILALILVGSVLLSFAASAAMLFISSLNYPGGEALAYLRETARAENPASSAVIPAHADVLSCMTGVTLFGTATGFATPNGNSGSWTGNLVNGRRGPSPSVSLTIDKTEDDAVLAQDEFWRRFDYVLAEDPTKVRGDDWEVVGLVQGYGGVELVGRSQPKAHDDDDEHIQSPVVGKGAIVARWKRRVRALTGGLWLGPRMVPRIYIMRRIKGHDKLRTAVDA